MNSAHFSPLAGLHVICLFAVFTGETFDQVSLAQMASRMATYMEVTPASPQKRLQAMGYSMLQLHLTSHLALISKTSQRKATEL